MSRTFPSLQDIHGDDIDLETGANANDPLAFIYKTKDAKGVPQPVDISSFTSIEMIGKVDRNDLDAAALILTITGTIQDTGADDDNRGRFQIDVSSLTLTTAETDIFLIFKVDVGGQKRVRAILQTNVIVV